MPHARPITRALAFITLNFLTPMTHSASFVYIGTQGAPDMGIALATFDPESGTLSAPTLIERTPDPAFLALSQSGAFLYLCNTGTPGGVSAFAVNRKSGALRLLNHQRSEGRGPSHIALDATDSFVLNANYGGGFLEIHAREPDGSLGNQTAFVRHTGSSVHPERQTKPYAHWFNVDPSNRYALAIDLGTDRIVVYRFDAKTGTLQPNDPPHFSVKAGSGPRHLAWHPNKQYAYVIQELTNEIITFAWDASKGTLQALQTVPTLPKEFSGRSTAAEIAVHANGKFLYASNRGHDSIATYAIANASGELTLLDHVNAGGKTPRYFTFDPSNRWLIVTNQDSGDIVTFAVDENTGRLTPHGKAQKLTKPMGIVFGK
jgi:6-phosphogluconolactonase